MILNTFLLSGTVTASAQTLRIGVLNGPESADPHWSANRPAFLMIDQAYEGLIALDSTGQPIPSLATHWFRRDDGAWVFSLRTGVRFHDGRPFGARDVLFSFCRVISPAMRDRPYSGRLAPVLRLEMPDDRTVVLHLTGPVALLPTEIATIPIIAAPPDAPRAFDPAGCATSSGFSREDFDAARVAVGTGPFRVVSFSPAETVLERHDGHWADPSDWSAVRLITMDSKRQIKAMMEGAVDMIDNFPVESAAYLRGAGDVEIVTGLSATIYYLQANQRPVEGNPFTDPRVRASLSAAIPRIQLAERVMAGMASPTRQMALPGMGGHEPSLDVDDYDVARARALLAEAGHPDGLDVEMLALRSQVRVAEAVGHFLRMAGIRTTLVVLEPEEFWTRLREGRFTLFFSGWMYTPSNLADSFQFLLGGPLQGRPAGQHNYAGFDADGQLSALLQRVVGMVPGPERDALLRQAAMLVAGEAGWTPLFIAHGRWAVRRGLVLRPRLDRLFLVSDIRRAAP